MLHLPAVMLELPVVCFDRICSVKYLIAVQKYLPQLEQVSQHHFENLQFALSLRGLKISKFTVETNLNKFGLIDCIDNPISFFG